MSGRAWAVRTIHPPPQPSGPFNTTQRQYKCEYDCTKRKRLQHISLYRQRMVVQLCMDAARTNFLQRLRGNHLKMAESAEAQVEGVGLLRDGVECVLLDWN